MRDSDVSGILQHLADRLGMARIVAGEDVLNGVIVEGEVIVAILILYASSLLSSVRNSCSGNSLSISFSICITRSCDVCKLRILSVVSLEYRSVQRMIFLQNCLGLLCVMSSLPFINKYLRQIKASIMYIILVIAQIVNRFYTRIILIAIIDNQRFFNTDTGLANLIACVLIITDNRLIKSAPFSSIKSSPVSIIILPRHLHHTTLIGGVFSCRHVLGGFADALCVQLNRLIEL